jgi:hypothetical protein
MYVISVSVDPSGTMGQMVLFGVADKLFSGESAFGWCSAHYFLHIFVIHGPDFIFSPPQ